MHKVGRSFCLKDSFACDRKAPRQELFSISYKNNIKISNKLSNCLICVILKKIILTFMHMPETILSTAGVREDAAFSFAMWTLLQASHILSIVGLLVSLHYNDRNLGPALSLIIYTLCIVAKYLLMRKLNN